MNKKNNNKGFTLAELLIVVAIIAVLVAIAIPVFTSQLEKSREATDLANIRSAYAQVVVDAIEDNSAQPQTVNMKQRVAGWVTPDADQTLDDICGDSGVHSGNPSGGTSATTTISWVTTGTGSGGGHVKIAVS